MLLQQTFVQTTTDSSSTSEWSARVDLNAAGEVYSQHFQWQRQLAGAAIEAPKDAILWVSLFCGGISERNRLEVMNARG